MMAHTDPADALDRLLREDAARTIPEDAFIARVMAALPAAAPRPMPWLRFALVMGSAALGSALAVILAPAEAAMLQGFIDLAHLRGFTLAALTTLAISGALLLSAIVLAADTE